MRYAQLKQHGKTNIWWVRIKRVWTQMDERTWRKLIPQFALLTEHGREKAIQDFLDSHTLYGEATAPAYTPNADKKTGNKSEDQEAVQILLGIGEIFKDSRAGYLILAYMIAGLHGSAFHHEASDIRFALGIQTHSNEIFAALKAITKATVTLKKWTGTDCVLKRKPILDCRKQRITSKRFHDFSCYKMKARHRIYPKPFRLEVCPQYSKTVRFLTPAPYVDTVATIIGADSAFLREASPYMDCCATFLIGCGSNDWGTAKLTASETAEYDPAIVQELKNMRYPIASILRDWWGAYDKKEEKIWAQNVVAHARKSFGKPDSRYITATIDPKKLRDKIAYFVLLDFLDYTVKQGWLTEEAVQVYRAGAQAVFDPQPVEDKPLRRMEQVDVFTEIMEMLRQENTDKIVPCGQDFVKSAKSFGAYREISGEQYLVMLENDWGKAYLKAAKKLNVDVSFAQRPNWERELQKLLCETEAIKAPSAGYRYRYDLYDNGTRDKTYVIAYPITA